MTLHVTDARFIYQAVAVCASPQLSSECGPYLRGLREHLGAAVFGTLLTVAAESFIG